MYCQPAYRVRRPPAITPTVAPPAPSPPQIPSALLRSAPSPNMFITIDRAAGSMIAAPMPWTARAAIMKPAPVASAAASDAALNSPSPSIRMRRRPSRSAARPPRSKNPPNVSAYAVTTHCRLVCGEVQVAADRRQRDIDDRQIDHRHEERHCQQRKRPPAIDMG